MRKYYLIIGALTIFVIFLVGIGIVDSGGPFASAGLKNDQKIIDDFSSLDYKIEDYVRENGRLPESLEALPSQNNNMIRNPKTEEIYGYKPLSKASYELCATFSADNKKLNEYSGGDYYDDYEDNRDYKKGYSCITYKVNSYAFDDYEDAEYFKNDLGEPDLSDDGDSLNSPESDEVF